MSILVLTPVLECLVEELPHIEYALSSQAPDAKWFTRQTKPKAWSLRSMLLLTPVQDSVTDATRFALCMWLDMIEGRATAMSIRAGRLQALLAWASRKYWLQIDELHQWVLLLGALCSKQASVVRDWFLRTFVDVYSPHTVGSAGEKIGFREADVEEVLRRVFYLQLIQRPMLPRLVRDLNQIMAG